ncbi:hypothetical protein ABS237_19710, partial [Acinetobacter baumannii]|uniref:hypothetical protein n=1 Tax=Acinetobacter baumannii TaxID=470 RepID=UPI00332F71FF
PDPGEATGLPSMVVLQTHNALMSYQRERRGKCGDNEHQRRPAAAGRRERCTVVGRQVAALPLPMQNVNEEVLRRLADALPNAHTAHPPR